MTKQTPPIDDGNLFEPAAPDRFEHESPIRAFTSFEVNGDYAIGKGFRPSIAHLGVYLAAMLDKENWRLVQILMPATASSGDPTVIFERVLLPMYTLDMPVLDPISTAMIDTIKRHAKMAVSPTRNHWEQARDVLKLFDAEAGEVKHETLFHRWGKDGLTVSYPQPGHKFVSIPENMTIESLIERAQVVVVGIQQVANQLRDGWRYTTMKDRLRGYATDLGLALGSKAPDFPGKYEAVIDNDRPTIYEAELAREAKPAVDMVNHPPHYNDHPSGLECIEIKRHMPSNVGDAFKYVWRAGEKGPFIEDIHKALWYIRDEKKRRTDWQPLLKAAPGTNFRQAMLADGIGAKFLAWAESKSATRGEEYQKAALRSLYRACLTGHNQSFLSNAERACSHLLHIGLSDKPEIDDADED